MFAHDAFILIPVVSPVCMRRVSWLHSSQSCLPPGGPWLAHYPDALLCLTLDFPLTFRPQDEDTVAKTRAALTAALNDFNMVCDTMDADIVRARVFALSVWRLTVLASSGRRLTTLFVHGRTANVSRLEKIPFNRPPMSLQATASRRDASQRRSTHRRVQSREPHLDKESVVHESQCKLTRACI